MQGDLISRKSVMELIESKCTDGCLGTADTTLIDAYGLIDEVSDLPTAYDVEKVVEQLEGIKNTHKELSKSEVLSDEDIYIHVLCHGLCLKVIEIVRASGKE